MKKYILVFLAVFLLFGCSDKQKEITLEYINTHKNIVIEDNSILKWLIIENIASVVRPDSMIEVEILTKNINSASKTVAYKIDWFDQNGFVVETILSKWRLLQIEGTRNAIIHGISPSQNVVSYKIRFQEPTSSDAKRDMNVNIKEFRGE
ncbi:MAG: DUF1425 domain-containing protein [Campylobacteraceae bacterium]|jgi:uncharacterized protein YcfL|nr:DUF1425 domain-containing protein [Campylobacteraceae bacterium]